MAKPRIDYKTREEHESRLRNIVLHSADALPDDVAAYIRTASEEARGQAREQILKTFVPLVEHLPAEFVDFALHELIEGSEEKGWASFQDMRELGIGGQESTIPRPTSRGHSSPCSAATKTKGSAWSTA